jgi:hypothetical protein
MSFKVVAHLPNDDGELEPEVILEIEDKRVTRVMLGSRTGGAGEIRIDPNQTEVTLDFEYANPYERNLVDLDALTHPQNQTGEDMEEFRERLDDSGRLTTNEGQDQFTPEAIEERERMEREIKEQQEEDSRRKEQGNQRDDAELETATS